MVAKNRDSEANRVKEAFAQESCPPASYQSMTRMSMQPEARQGGGYKHRQGWECVHTESCPVQSGRGQGERGI